MPLCVELLVTGGRGAHLHLVDALFRLGDAPELLLVGASEPDVGPAVGAVPAGLAVLVAEDHAGAFAEALAVEAVLVVGQLVVDALKVAHVCVSVALFGLLHRLVEPAELVGVFAGVNLDALVLEGAEDFRGAVLGRQVRLLGLEILLLGAQLAVHRVGGLAGLLGGL